MLVNTVESLAKVPPLVRRISVDGIAPRNVWMLFGTMRRSERTRWIGLFWFNLISLPPHTLTLRLPHDHLPALQMLATSSDLEVSISKLEVLMRCQAFERLYSKLPNIPSSNIPLPSIRFSNIRNIPPSNRQHSAPKRFNIWLSKYSNANQARGSSLDVLSMCAISLIWLLGRHCLTDGEWFNNESAC